MHRVTTAANLSQLRCPDTTYTQIEGRRQRRSGRWRRAKERVRHRGKLKASRERLAKLFYAGEFPGLAYASDVHGLPPVVVTIHLL